MELLIIPLVLAGAFAFPFVMAWLEPAPQHRPSHRAGPRRASLR